MSDGIDNCLPLWSSCSGVYKVFLFLVLIICAYWLVLRIAYGDSVVDNDPMNKIVFKVPFLENCCSWWPISHFVVFFIIGVLFPNCGLVAMTGGIIWELIEVFLSALQSKPRQGVRTSKGDVQYSQNWWAGSIKDVFANFAGFYLGKLVVTVYRKIKS